MILLSGIRLLSVVLMDHEHFLPHHSTVSVGMVDKINPDGTYNLVKLEESTLIPSMKPDLFRKYHVYPPGTQAFYQEARGVHVPVTIVNYVPDKHLMNPQQPGLELIGGKYQFMFDSDDTQKIAEGNTIRIHRFAEVGDV